MLFRGFRERFDVAPVEPEQLLFPFPAEDELVMSEDKTVTLPATENGAQLFVSGFGLYMGKKDERIVVKQGGKVCAQVPFFRMQELILASKGTETDEGRCPREGEAKRVKFVRLTSLIYTGIRLDDKELPR